jgi:hypothetical protein
VRDSTRGFVIGGQAVRWMPPAVPLEIQAIQVDATLDP